MKLYAIGVAVIPSGSFAQFYYTTLSEHVILQSCGKMLEFIKMF